MSEQHPLPECNLQFAHIRESLTKIEAKLDGLDTSIRGNGQAGLRDRVGDLETFRANLEAHEQERRADRKWGWKLIIGAVVVNTFATIAFLFREAFK